MCSLNLHTLTLAHGWFTSQAHRPISWLLDVLVHVFVTLCFVLLDLRGFVAMFAKQLENVGGFADEMRCLGQFPVEFGLLKPAQVLLEFKIRREFDQDGIDLLKV